MYQIITALCIASLSASALAQVQIHAKGRETVRFSSANSGVDELCILPQTFPGVTYPKGDVDVESKLCRMDVHNQQGAYAVCPKLKSTNPALEFFEVPKGSSRLAVENSRCESPGLKKLAKYKVSTSCSYTPSILAHFGGGYVHDKKNCQL